MITSAIGIVGGTGWLGGSIAQALLDARLIEPGRLTVSYRSSPPPVARVPGVTYTDRNDLLADNADVIIVSVRPGQFQDVAIDASRHLVVSVMAGIRVSTIEARLHTRRVVRAIPNAAASIRRSYTPWYAGPGATPEDRALVQTLLGACGEAEQVATEELIDYFTGLTGSGAAHLALLADALIHDAINRGVSAESSARAIRTLIDGSTRLLIDGTESPAQIVKTMRDYRGTTAAALDAMITRGFYEAVRAGLAAAEATAITMGRGL
jgi:pyrroline-5-carboxylate reductase